MEVKEKKVGQIELFYDLIYVYAISRLTLLIEEPVQGMIPLSGFLRYIVICLVVLQAWLYMTNYINRYGQWKWYEYCLTSINMIASVYMANTISLEWNKMSLTFNLAMLVMLLCVAGLYFIQLRLKKQDPGAAKNSLTILPVACLLYFSAFLASAFHAEDIGMGLDIVAVLTGAFLPFFIRGKFDIRIISFPHLVERFELITIITFGECVVGMTDFFDVRNFSFRPILVFVIILALYGCYIIQIHWLCNHHRVDRSLRLMFSHYFIVISINLITVAFKFLENTESNKFFTAILMSAGLMLFFISLYANRYYYHKRFSFTIKDGVISFSSVVLGMVIMLLSKTNIYGFLIGALIAVTGNFGMLFYKYKS